MADSYTELWKHLKHDKAMIREGNIEFTIFKDTGEPGGLPSMGSHRVGHN